MNRNIRQFLTVIRFQVTFGAAIILILLPLAILGPLLMDAYSFRTAPYVPPNLKYLAGTDLLGRDILARMIIGTGQSLTVAFISSGVAAVVGGLSGLVIGYIGGRIDRLASLVVDAWYSIPDIVLALVIGVVLGRGSFNMGIAIGLALVPQFFRVLRAQVLSVKSATYLEAERVLGAGRLYILSRHLIRLTLPPFVVMITLGMARSILALGGLGFLGLGIPPPTPEWGSDIGVAETAILSGIWWPSFFPGFMILVAVIGFNQFGNGLNSILVRRRTTGAS